MAKLSQRTEQLLARSNGQTLYQHTKEVLKYSLEIYDTGPLEKELEIAALLHDLGKAQETYQQVYRGKNTGQREHAVSSAWICRLLPAIPGHEHIHCVAARLIESHHKGLEQSNDVTARMRALRDAYDALRHLISQNDRWLDLAESHGISAHDLQQAMRLLEILLRIAERAPASLSGRLDRMEIRGSDKVAQNMGISSILEVRKALGALVVADSLSATGSKPDVLKTKRKQIKPEAIRKFVRGKQKNRPIDQIRNKIGQYVEEIAKTVNLRKRIFTISLPTGAGKTLHALRFALILRERVKKELRKDPPRIIYVMPFTTIIDQAYDVFAKVYGDSVEKRHYLADEKRPDEVPEELYNIVRLLYPSEITVITYVQLYSALVGNRRRDAIRALGLRNRIIILDEVQAVPYAHWLVMKELLRTLSRENWLVLMSATVPKYVVPEGAQKIVSSEDLPDPKVFIRHRFTKRGFDSYEDVVREALRKYMDEGLSVAIVVNTVSTAEQLYLLAKNLLKEEYGVELHATESGAVHENGCAVYLSTYVPPFARKPRIEKFESRVFAVTTQVIEAGVDVSVDVLYRELAPVDSIVQAAGRCNRNGERDISNVIVFSTPETQEKFINVYGKVLWIATNAALEDWNKFTDADIDAVLKKYYAYVDESKAPEGVLDQIMRSVQMCSFSTDIRAIENIPKVPVIVMYPKASKIIDELETEYKKHDKDRKKIAQLLKQLGQYIVNVYPKQADRFKEIAIGDLVFRCADPHDENNYVKDLGLLYNPRNDPNAFEDRLA